MIEMKEFFTPYLHIFLHAVYICSTYIPSCHEHMLHLYAFVVCSCTPPMFLYGMPVDLVIVIKKIQHNGSFSLLQLCRWGLHFAGMWPQHNMVHAQM